MNVDTMSILTLQMDEALMKLEELKNTTELNRIKVALDKLKNAPKDKKSDVRIDWILKEIFRRNHTAELFDRIEEVFDYVKDPRIFIDELDIFTEDKNLIIPTLMFIYNLRRRFDFEYDDFYKKLHESIQRDNCQSEGYLLFLLKALKDTQIDDNDIKPIIVRLSEISTEISSRGCVKVLYTIIVILRMHPGLFRIVKDLNHLYILLESLDSINRIARRIFIEAENPEMRPTMVFLENFTFPELEQQ